MTEGSGPDSEWERKAGHPDIVVVGVDEVGRGCLAGPVVAGAVVLPPAVRRSGWLKEVNDSKLLSAETRERLAVNIREWALKHAVAEASVQEIDRLNIHEASHLAMLRAIEALGVQAQHILVDGKFLPKRLPCPGTAIVKGDQRCLSIACASIIAKVHRDAMMRELDSVYPGYGLAEHKGYSTPDHKDALRRLGPVAIHRRSFAPVAELLPKAESPQLAFFE